jgi:hypothetical protein
LEVAPLSPEEIYEVVHRQPFTPIRVHMSNGRQHDIRHPDDVVVGQEAIAVGVYGEGSRFPSLRLLSIININEIEPLASAKSP